MNTTTEGRGMQKISETIWDTKYRSKAPDGTSKESSKKDTYARVISGVYLASEYDQAQIAYNEMLEERWVPAGRILAGAGTNRRVTWINCFVSPLIQDSMDSNEGEQGEGIMDALKTAALTQQMGGGIGMDFSTLRPRGAIVGRTGSVSSGPLHFMDMWHSMCSTVMSSGSRRGAMMGTMRIDHPDIVDFIEAKHKHGRLTNFNVSILVTDDFMKCLADDGLWELGFIIPRADGVHKSIEERAGKTWYVYEQIKARDLWDLITESTYKYAEPGVIFIDRVNRRNNLNYCETISCTNPCGEQPLPPNGDCNLGAVNLAKMVKDPFGVKPKLDVDQIRFTTMVGVRFLDNVLDHTPFPTVAQSLEARSKRRIGLGITGLGNMLQQLKIRYGSQEAVELSRMVMYNIADAAYRQSALLAKERGVFAKYDKEAYSKNDFVMGLSEETRDLVREHGLRNGVLLTIAPTGTTSILIGNVSSGCEPTFAWTYDRKVRKPHGDGFDEFEVRDYGYGQYCETVLAGRKPNGEGLPPYMVTATELTVDEHLRMQAGLQEWVDASISKTINCPESMTLAEFRQVYQYAWDLGLKGCTTYRPSDVRGAVMTVKKEPSKEASATPTLKRPEVLRGTTYKIKWAGIDHAFYVTINDHEDEASGRTLPFEVFINSKSVQHAEWIAALTRTISAVFRRGGDLTFLSEELEQVHSPSGGQWVSGTYVPSLVAMIGRIIRLHMVKLGLVEEPKEVMPRYGICPACEQHQYVSESGCKKCLNCGHSSCD